MTTLVSSGWLASMSMRFMKVSEPRAKSHATPRNFGPGMRAGAGAQFRGEMRGATFRRNGGQGRDSEGRRRETDVHFKTTGPEGPQEECRMADRPEGGKAR